VEPAGSHSEQRNLRFVRYWNLESPVELVRQLIPCCCELQVELLAAPMHRELRAVVHHLELPKMQLHLEPWVALLDLEDSFLNLVGCLGR